MASDAPMTTPTTEMPADHVTKQTYEETKALAEERASRLANAEARLQAYETRERAQLQSYQPAMEDLVKDLAAEYGTVDNKAHFESFGEWAKTCHQRPALDTQMQLGTIIHACASKLKRTREEASVQSATSEQLAAIAKENETLKEQVSSKDARIGELSSSLKEIQTNSEKLQLQLEQAGALKEKFDFSKASSREEGAEKNELSVKTENASRGALGQVAPADPSMALFAFAMNHSANTRFMPSVSNHSILGADAAASSGNVGLALRPM